MSRGGNYASRGTFVHEGVEPLLELRLEKSGKILPADLTLSGLENRPGERPGFAARAHSGEEEDEAGLAEPQQYLTATSDGSAVGSSRICARRRAAT